MLQLISLLSGCNLGAAFVSEGYKEKQSPLPPHTHTHHPLHLSLFPSLFYSLFYHYTSQKNKLCLLKILESVIFFCLFCYCFSKKKGEEEQDKVEGVKEK